MGTAFIVADVTLIYYYSSSLNILSYDIKFGWFFGSKTYSVVSKYITVRFVIYKGFGVHEIHVQQRFG
jgi:hypothetical protein